MNFNQNIKEIQANLLNGRVSMAEMVRYYLDNAHKNEHLNMYLALFDEEIEAQALLLDEKIKKNPASLGKLFGLVISIKDVICYKNHTLSAGSKILDGFESLFTATALQRLLDEDVLVIGRTNCDEFAMGSSNENSAYGVCKNAKHPKHIAGGSSGGAAVSVQAETCLLALGSDTGGSVRQPASFCDLTGFKPSYGRISRYGLIAYGSSFDQIGVIGRAIEDIALCYQIMGGYDDRDATSSHKKVECFDVENKREHSKFAIFSNIKDSKNINPVIRADMNLFLEKLEKNGHELSEIEFDLLPYLVPCYYILTTAEASSNLGRYDGIRFGNRQKASNLAESYTKTRSLGFGKEVKRRIILGSFVLSSGYYDAYFTKAQKVRRMIRHSIDAIFETHDFLILPTTADVAWEIGNYDNDPVTVYLSDIFTVIANITGIPAVSIPLGKTDKGLSYGIQVLTKNFQEKKLLEICAEIQSWH